MITVTNTRELETRYDLSKIRDDEPIFVLGGMAGKPKYNQKGIKKEEHIVEEN